jgi:hypothetical protein
VAAKRQQKIINKKSTKRKHSQKENERQEKARKRAIFRRANKQKDTKKEKKKGRNGVLVWQKRKTEPGKKQHKPARREEGEERGEGK